MSSEQIRINKFLSQAGFCSRRKADQLIGQNRVTLNGEVPEMGTKVLKGDQVEVDGESIEIKESPVYLILNKPSGIVCTTDRKREKNNIIDFVNYPKRIFPIGRLDKPSEGLILLTNDGDIVNKILRSSNHHEKQYQVETDRPITEEFLNRMSNGIPVLDTVTKKCETKKTGDYQIEINLTQGLNRQIRRMCEYLGFQIVRLKRLRVMNIKLDIPVGEYRELTTEELKTLKKLTQVSSKSETKS